MHIKKFKNFFLLDENLNNSYVSGNKFRKLQGILRSAGTIEGILSFGSPYSSHLLACAYYGKILELPVTGIIISEREIKTIRFPYLNMTKKFGTKLIFTDMVNAFSIIEKYKKQLPQYLWIPGGGHTLEAAKEYELFFDELFKKENIWSHINKIILPFGTGTTAYGIWMSVRKQENPIEVIGVSVSRNKDKCIYAVKEMEGLDKFPGLTIIDQFSGRYGQRDNESEKNRWRFFKETKVLPDPIYNARAVQYFYEQNYTNALIVNTGGMLNNLL